MNLRAHAEDTLRRAGSTLRAQLCQSHQVELKGPADLVTDVDRAVQAEVTAALAATDLPVCGEEDPGAWHEGWLLDPLDGTTNFVHGLAHFAISLALMRAGRPVLALTYDPVRDELFVAESGQGAYLGAQRLRVSSTPQLDQALLATGFAPAPASQFAAHQELLSLSRGIRCLGCASLDLAYVACGRLDGFWEVDLKPWDVAAGLLLIEEAGGRVSNLQGHPAAPDAYAFLASNGRLHPALLERLNRVLP